MFKNRKMSHPNPVFWKHLQYKDLVQLSTMYAAEFNNEGIHDRVLVFKVTDEDECGSVENCEDRRVDSSTSETDGGFVFKDSLSGTSSFCSVGSNVFGNTSNNNPPAIGSSTSVTAPIFAPSTTTKTGAGVFASSTTSATTTVASGKSGFFSATTTSAPLFTPSSTTNTPTFSFTSCTTPVATRVPTGKSGFFGATTTSAPLFTPSTKTKTGASVFASSITSAKTTAPIFTLSTTTNTPTFSFATCTASATTAVPSRKSGYFSGTRTPARSFTPSTTTNTGVGVFASCTTSATTTAPTFSPSTTTKTAAGVFASSTTSATTTVASGKSGFLSGMTTTQAQIFTPSSTTNTPTFSFTSSTTPVATRAPLFSVFTPSTTAKTGAGVFAPSTTSATTTVASGKSGFFSGMTTTQAPLITPSTTTKTGACVFASCTTSATTTAPLFATSTTTNTAASVFASCTTSATTTASMLTMWTTTNTPTFCFASPTTTATTRAPLFATSTTTNTAASVFASCTTSATTTAPIFTTPSTGTNTGTGVFASSTTSATTTASILTMWTTTNTPTFCFASSTTTATTRGAAGIIKKPIRRTRTRGASSTTTNTGTGLFGSSSATVTTTDQTSSTTTNTGTGLLESSTATVTTTVGHTAEETLPPKFVNFSAKDYKRESAKPKLHEILFDVRPNEVRSHLGTGEEIQQEKVEAYEEIKDMQAGTLSEDIKEKVGQRDDVLGATAEEVKPDDGNEETKNNGKEGRAENGEERDLSIDRAEQKKFLEKRDAKKLLERSENEESNEETDYPDDEPDERKLYVHSSWLAVQSSYFRALLFPEGNKEPSSTEVVMKIPKRELQAHITLIAAMYNFDILDGKNYQEVLRVFLLAHKYDVKFVFRKCKYIILSTPLTLKKSEFLVKTIAKIPNCGDIKKTIYNYILQRFSPLDETWRKKEFQSLSKALLCMLLGSNDLVVASENTVFVALMRWIEFRDDFEAVRSLLSLVRFKLMSFDFLHDVVRHHKLAQKMDGFNEFLMEGFTYHGHSMSRLRKLNMKPTKRVLYNKARPPFSWEINQSAHDSMLKQDYIRSDAFWVKGYEIILQLTYHKDTNMFDLSVFVRNVNPGGYVEIGWRAQSELFQECTTPNMKAAHITSQGGFCLRDLACAIPAPNFTSETKSWKIDVWITI